MPPLSLLIKPASGNCNMRCSYCFYCDEAEKRKKKSYGIMDIGTMRAIVNKALDIASGYCAFVFQGGEPTLAGLEFYRETISYIKEKNQLRKVGISYAIQTNGLSVTDEWALFFKENNFLVGLSLDGTESVHDSFRRDNGGKGTHHAVMRAVGILKKHEVEFNILTVVTAKTANSAEDIYEFYRREGLVYQQYIECLDPLGEISGKMEYSLIPDAYEKFLKKIFDLWLEDMEHDRFVYNRYFENLAMMVAGQLPESCNMRGRCSNQWVIEADGSVYPCDFYALDQWYLGNILENTFEEMEEQRSRSGFIRWSFQTAPECRVCKWAALCRGGCRRNREPVTELSTGKNYFCSAYYGFLEYAYPKIYRFMQQKGVIASQELYAPVRKGGVAE